jgi:sarcosine oxidase subunit alpha
VTSQNARLSTGGRIDRSISWRFTVDGEEFTGHPGDTLASALLANGRIAAGNSLYEDRARGILAAGVEEPNALVRIEARFPGDVAESMLPATTVSLVDGLKAGFLNGLGKLDPADDRAEYDKKYVHTDILVIGGGPAGLAAAREAVRSGARVILMDDQPELGGSLLSGSTASELAETIEGKPALEWVADVEAELVSGAESTVLNRTTAFGAYDANYVIAVQNRTDHLSSPAAAGVSRQRIWHIRANQVVLAPGAHERPLVFENNDRPGIMLASAVRSYLNRYGVAAGSRVVISTTNDSAYALASDLRAAGIKVAAVVDARPALTTVAAAAVEAGTRVLIGSAVANTASTGEGTAGGRLSSVTVRSINDDGELTSGIEEIAADLLAVSGGWSPLVHLHSQRQGKLRWDEDLAAFVPATVVPNQQTIGSGRGSFELADCLAEGISAGATAAIAAGFESAVEPSALAEPKASAPTRQLWLVPGQTGTPDDWHHHFVDLHRDQTVADVWRATGAGMRSVEHVKRYTSIGTGQDQGKTSGVNAGGVIAAALGLEVGEVGFSNHRAPYTPVLFSALAGRERGDLFDPKRITRSTTGTSSTVPSSRSWASGCGRGTSPQEGEDLDARAAA